MRIKFRALSLMIVFAAALLCNVAHSAIRYENLRFQQLDVLSNMPNRTIRSIVQDNIGYMWFGTANGLYRYDGYDVDMYFHSGDDTTSLMSDYIDMLYNDEHNGILWVVCEDGLCRYDARTDGFKRYDINRADINGQTPFVASRSGELYLVERRRILRYDVSKDCFVPYADAMLNGRRVKTAQMDLDGYVWILTPEGFLKCDLEQQTLLAVPQVLHLDDVARVGRMELLDGRYLLFSLNQSLYVYDIVAESLCNTPFPDKVTFVRDLAVDGEGNIWMGSEYGVFVFDAQCRQLAHYECTPLDQSNLNDSPVYSIYRDRDGNMWVGTYFGGVNYYVVESDRFRVYAHGVAENMLSGKAVRQIVPSPDGGMYIATEDGGLNYMTKEHRIVNSATLNERIPITTKNVHGVYYDRDGNLWIGQFLNDVSRYDASTGTTTHYRLDHNRLVSCFDILQDDEGVMWCAGPNGLYSMRMQGGEYKVRQHNNLQIHSIMNFSDSILWMGTRHSGLLQFNKNSGASTLVIDEEYANAFVTYIYRDSRDRIWVATGNDGLLLVDSDCNIIEQYIDVGVGSNLIKGVVEDDRGNIWFGSEMGLGVVDSDSKKVRRYRVEDGLPFNQFNYSSASVADDGELFFGTINGMVSFYPNELRDPRLPRFDIAFTDIWAGDEPITIASDDVLLDERGERIVQMTLDHRQAQSLRIEYSALNYRYCDQVHYSTRLDPADDTWQYVGKQHQVRYSNLPAGRYELRVMASHNAKDWDEESAQRIVITIKPAPWLSPLAYCLYSLLFVLILYLAYRFTKSRITLRMELESEHKLRLNDELLNEKKIEFFTQVSHDLKTPLTLIVSPLQLLADKAHIDDGDVQSLRMVYRNARRMQDLIEELMLFSRADRQLITNNMRCGDIMLFLREVAAVFETSARAKHIDYSVTIAQQEGESWFSPSNLDRIMNNLLSNAFKYTQERGQISMDASFVEEDGGRFVCVRITDNGRGIPEELHEKIFESYFQVDKRDHRVGSGLGLALTRSLVEAHKGRIEVQSRVGHGTTFTIWLNVSRGAYSDGERSIEPITMEHIQSYTAKAHDVLEVVAPAVNELSTADVDEALETLMVVEDNVDMNNYIRGIFESKYRVVQAFDGAEALELMADAMPTIVISDVMMPRMDGIELLRRLRGDLTTSHISVVLLSAKGEESDVTSGYLEGADAYISKPFSAKNLELLVGNMVGNRRRNIDKLRLGNDFDVKPIITNSRDEDFLRQLIELIQANLSSEDFDVAQITAHFNISRSLLHTKLKSITGSSASQFVRTVKMKEARNALQRGLNVSETSFLVGMDSSYFSKCFKREFDTTPTDYIRSLREEANS